MSVLPALRPTVRHCHARCLGMLGLCVLFGTALGSPAPAQGATAVRHPAAPKGATQTSSSADSIGLFHLTSQHCVLHRTPRGDEVHAFKVDFHSTAFLDSTPVAGDFEGDGFDTIGTYDFRTETFRLCNTLGLEDAAIEIPFDVVGLPLVGDWDGDGTDTIGGFDPATNTFLLRNSNTPGPADLAFVFGNGSTQAVAGDWDGDGVDTIGLFNTGSQIFRLRNSNTTGPADLVIDFSPHSGVAVAADVDGDGRDEVGVYDPAVNSWSFHLVGPGAGAHVPMQIDMPVGAVHPVTGRWQQTAPIDAAFDWPTASPASQNIDPAMLDAAFTRAHNMDNNVTSLLVFRHGLLVQEEYWNGFDAETAINVKSINKTILGLLCGIAIDQGHIAGVDTTLESILPSLFDPSMDPRKYQISIANMLRMQCGFQWNELNFFTPMVNSNDWAQWVIDMPQQNDPGSAFLYATGITHLMSRALTAATGVDTADFAQQHLFGPLGVTLRHWSRDSQSYDFGGSELFLTPRDLARVGHLFMQDGLVDGQQIVPAAWIATTTSPLVPTWMIDNVRNYGYYLWQKTYAGHPIYYMIGWGGQFVFCFEALDLMIVCSSRWDVNIVQSSAHVKLVEDLVENHIIPAVQ